MKWTAVLFSAAVFAGCGGDAAGPERITATGIVAELTPAGVRITNYTDEPAAFAVHNPNWFGLLALCMTPDPACERLRPGAVIVVPFDEITGYETGAPIYADWWRVEGSAPPYHTVEVNTIIVK